MSELLIKGTSIMGLKVIERVQRRDSRGFLSRLFCAEELSEAGWKKPIAQTNHTHSVKKGTVRGMHFQHPPHAEMKLVNCIAGKVWDIALDLRRGSPTFLKWHGEELSLENGRALLIPEGFAHGFQTLTPDCTLIYFHSHAYHSDSEGGINPIDPIVGIKWPDSISELSERDEKHPMLTTKFQGISL